jgi:acyl-CoA thioester hydrolase
MFTYGRKAQYHETDQMGVIHHASYVKWMEEARVAFLDTLGCGYEAIEQSGVVVPVIGISVEYKRPVRFAESFEVEVRVERYNGRILELGYTIRNLTAGTLCTLAASKHCFLKDGRMVSPKTELPALHAILTGLSEEKKEEA